MKRYKTTRQKERNKMPKFRLNDIINNAKTKVTVKVVGINEHDKINMYQLKPLNGFNEYGFYREDYWWTEETINECFELVTTELKFKVGDKLQHVNFSKDVITIAVADPSNEYFTYQIEGDNYRWARSSIEDYYKLYEPTYEDLVKAVRDAKEVYAHYKKEYQNAQKVMIEKQDLLDNANHALWEYVEKDCD